MNQQPHRAGLLGDMAFVFAWVWWILTRTTLRKVLCLTAVAILLVTSVALTRQQDQAIEMRNVCTVAVTGKLGLEDLQSNSFDTADITNVDEDTQRITGSITRSLANGAELTIPASCTASFTPGSHGRYSKVVVEIGRAETQSSVGASGVYSTTGPRTGASTVETTTSPQVEGSSTSTSTPPAGDEVSTASETFSVSTLRKAINAHTQCEDLWKSASDGSLQCDTDGGRIYQIYKGASLATISENIAYFSDQAVGGDYYGAWTDSVGVSMPAADSNWIDKAVQKSMRGDGITEQTGTEEPGQSRFRH